MAPSSGRGQPPGGGRYAFADSSLMRDTLGLSFQRLFPLSDSLQVRPDTLRALSIRYLWSLERLVHLADSLGVAVDSVGPALLRERFNPLAAKSGPRNTFTYNSGYNVGQTQSAWTNTTDYGLHSGSLFVHNATTVEMDRYRVGKATSLRQTRNSATELGWLLSPGFSVGARIGLDRLDTRDASTHQRLSDVTDQYQLSVRTRQQPLTGMTSEINFFSGLLGVQNSTLLKHGLSGRFDSHIKYSPATWLTQDLNAAMGGNLSRTRSPDVSASHQTRDFSQNVRGSMSLFASAPVSLRGNFLFRHVQVVTPDNTGAIRSVLSDNSSGESTLRLRADNDRYADITIRTATAKQATVVGALSRNSRRDDGVDVAGRYLIWSCAIDARLQNGFNNSKFPNRSATGGYGEFVHDRTLDASLSRGLGRRLAARITATLGLVSYRYSVIGSYATPPVSRDDWRQSWRAEGTYTPGGRFSTGITLQVGKYRLINIPGSSTGSNSNTRSYSSEWNWTCRLLQGLTATQRNSLSADYLEYPFFPDNNRLTLNYASVTTLDAILSPRLSVSMTHNTRQNPGGNYTAYPDGLYYFARADDNRTASLSASIGYTPSRAISFTINPDYFASDRTASSNGVTAPQRSARSFSLTGGVSVNWTVFEKGALRGNINRGYRADRSITYASGVPEVTPRSQFNYWNGSLQLSWHL